MIPYAGRNLIRFLMNSVISVPSVVIQNVICAKLMNWSYHERPVPRSDAHGPHQPSDCSRLAFGDWEEPDVSAWRLEWAAAAWQHSKTYA